MAAALEADHVAGSAIKARVEQKWMKEEEEIRAALKAAKEAEEAAGLSKKKPEGDKKPVDTKFLQVDGVPVLVHPESMLLPDVTQTGIAFETIFPTGTLVVGPDEISVVQLDE